MDNKCKICQKKYSDDKCTCELSSRILELQSQNTELIGHNMGFMRLIYSFTEELDSLTQEQGFDFVSERFKNTLKLMSLLAKETEDISNETIN